jgi:1-deoxy-D-xylulose-5-phosphate synthase
VGVPLGQEYRILPIGESELLREGGDLVIIALGSMVTPSVQAAALLEEEGFSVGVVNCRYVKPLDKKLVGYAQSCGKVLVVEENIRQGGLSSAFLELLNDMEVRDVQVKRIGLPDAFVEHGPLALLRSNLGLDAPGIAGVARAFFK